MAGTVLSNENRRQKEKVVRFLRYRGHELAKKNLVKLATNIFRHFLHLENVKGLDHSLETVYDRLVSDQAITILAVNNGSIIGYLVADQTLYNMENLMHIYYLYVIPSFRNKGVATFMLECITDYALEQGINALSLTYDTNDKNLTRFYNNNKFYFDDGIRSYQRYDMLVRRV